MCNNCYCTPLCHCAEYIQSRSVQISSDQLSSGISRPDWPWRRESPHPMPHPLLNDDSLGLLDFRSTGFKFQMVSNRSWSWLVPAFALSFIRAQACIGLLTWSKDHPSSTLPQAPNRKSTWNGIASQNPLCLRPAAGCRPEVFHAGWKHSGRNPHEYLTLSDAIVPYYCTLS